MRFIFKISLPLIIITVVFFLFSCSKEESKEILISGIISDGNQLKPVDDAKVTFWASRLQNGTYNPNMIALATVNTDINGNYSFSLQKEKDAAYRISIEKKNYFGSLIDINVVDLPAGNHTLNYKILPEAFIKLHVKNISPNDNTDIIGYYFNSLQPEGNICCTNTPFSGAGYFYENIHLCKTYGAQNINLKWNVKKNGFNLFYDTLIYCAPFDTTVFNLYY